MSAIKHIRRRGREKGEGGMSVSNKNRFLEVGDRGEDKNIDNTVIIVL